MRPGRLWEQAEPHLKAVIDVNLGGVINGVRAFVPPMIASGQAGRVINTASLAGLVAAPGLSAYCISKHAVVALSETLAIDLQMAGHPIEVSVICPSAVATNIMNAAVSALRDTQDDEACTLARQMAEGIQRVGATPTEAGEAIFRAIDAGLFWIRPCEESMKPVIRRAESIETGLAPRFQGWED
jgi:NAD(P)-dependent dehydrogenase (short-subunit alcohol dehydrogenase family)